MQDLAGGFPAAVGFGGGSIMSQWSKLWELPVRERKAALLAARFTAPVAVGSKQGGVPSVQPFRKP